MTYDELKDILAHIIAVEVDTSGHTQKVFAREMGITQSKLSGILTGNRMGDVSFATLLALVQDLGWDIDIKVTKQGLE
jgi:transcriptional regulator with XRE-family HTH domain